MLTIKVAYNNETGDQVSCLFGYPGLESYNEDDYREKKKAIQLKASCGAKELPFVAFYHDGELVKGLYSEVSECTPEKIHEFIREYIDKHAHKGWITVQKVEGRNNERIPVGKQYSGATGTFIEGFSCHISSRTHWFRSSNVVSIDWEKGEFKTLNSIYKFTFRPFDNDEQPV